MQNQMNFTKPNGDDFRFHGAQASLDLFAEELPEQHDLLLPACRGCVSTVSTVGGTFATFSSASSVA